MTGFYRLLLLTIVWLLLASHKLDNTVQIGICTHTFTICPEKHSKLCPNHPEVFAGGKRRSIRKGRIYIDMHILLSWNHPQARKSNCLMLQFKGPFRTTVRKHKEICAVFLQQTQLLCCWTTSQLLHFIWTISADRHQQPVLACHRHISVCISDMFQLENSLLTEPEAEIALSSYVK